ncbi:MAG: outer membrane protein assembly factor BamA [Myxococcales bacterium]
MMPLSFGLLMRQKLGPLTPATRRRIPWRILPICVSTLCASQVAYAQAPGAGPLGGAAVDGLGTPDNARVLAPSLRNEADAARDLPILGIEVAGNRRVTAEDIVTYLREKRGDPFSPEKLAQDVRELWGSGFFDDVVVELERSDVGVTLRFLVRERATIADVEFVGNDEIDKDDIKEAIETKPSSIMSQPAIGRSVQKIRDMYAEKGYFLAEVESQVIALRNNEVRVRFTIKENKQVSVRRVSFVGNAHLTDQELQNSMLTGSGGLLSFGSGGPFRQDAFERDVAVLSALYYDRGFLQVSVATPRIMLTPDRSGIEVALTIDEGPRFRIRQLRVFERGADGTEVEPLEGRRNLRMMLRAEPGDYFNRAALLEDLQAIRLMYRNAGYANVEASPETRVDPDKNEVDVVIPVVRGPLVRFERIEFRGNTKTRDKVLRRELEITEGDKFSESGLDASKRRLTALGYFERVDVSTEQGSSPDKMLVYFEVAERPTGTFQIGAGFSSIERFIATAQIQQANLFGNGQSLSLQAQLSGIRQLVNLRIFEPYFLDSPFNASLELYNQRRSYTDFTQTSRGGALTFGYPLIAPKLYASLTYTGEDTTISTDTTSGYFSSAIGLSVFRRLPLANLFNDGVTSSIRPALTFDTRDNRLFPSSGVYLRASSEFANSVLGSQNEFLRHHLTGRFYYPLISGLVFKVNAEFDHVTSPNPEGVPIFARSYLGGIYDVRGFRFRTLGPRVPLTSSTDPNSLPMSSGANIGGNLSYFQNIELEATILESVGIKGVLFTDAGNAWNLERNYCDATLPIYPENSPCWRGWDSVKLLRTSWGFGLRWFSPLGPLRFEWGFPFKTLPGEEKSVFEFTIGNFF